MLMYHTNIRMCSSSSNGHPTGMHALILVRESFVLCEQRHESYGTIGTNPTIILRREPIPEPLTIIDERGEKRNFILMWMFLSDGRFY